MPSWCIWSMASIISIHAPARGATKVTVHFNQNHSNISIHAPARGATCQALLFKISFQFQSTLPRGERQKTQPKHVRDNRFQSTLPRGERPPSFPARSRCCRYFNPRSREGSDMPELRLTCGKKISIHAPARGATATASVGFARFVNFNPRSREGSDVLPSARPP